MVGRLAGMQSSALTAEDVAIISYKDQRTGAWPQIQLIGSSNGVDVYRAKSEETLTEIIANLSTKMLLIIDTPGHKCLEQVTDIHAHVPTARFHLAIPADASSATLRRMIDEGPVQWQSLMITKSDECVNAWPLLEFLCNHRTSISFVGDVAINGDHDVLTRAIGNLAEISVEQLKTSQVTAQSTLISPSPRAHVLRTN
jgi:flagellar biosynthesis GTPase FlhF